MKTETPDSSLAVTGAVFLSTSSSFANIKKKKSTKLHHFYKSGVSVYAVVGCSSLCG